MVNTFSPQTNLMSHSLFGGFFGPELKFAGYDRIIIKGKAPDLVYLYIHNDQVEIRDATHLRGKGTTETQDLLKKELKDQRFQVAAIGLAGENRVYMASIDHNHASASRGVGVIMGDKRLKAIAVRGTRDLNIARPAELFELSQALHKKIGEGDGNGDWMAVDEDDSFHHNHFAWGNARTRRKNFWSDELQERWTKWKLRSHGPADRLLQLREEMPQRDQLAGTAALRLQVLRQGHLPHGGVPGAGLHLRDPRCGPGIRRSIPTRRRRSSPSPSSCSRPAS